MTHTTTYKYNPNKDTLYGKIESDEISIHLDNNLQAMANESLHLKRNIAIELAWRDFRIEKLMDMFSSQRDEIEKLQKQRFNHEQKRGEYASRIFTNNVRIEFIDGCAVSPPLVFKKGLSIVSIELADELIKQLNQKPTINE